MAPSTQAREMKSRMMRRYTGGFVGFNDLEERMKIEQEEVWKMEVEKTHQKRREENVQLARGEEVDLSERSAESLEEDQLNTIRDILSDLGGETEKK